jgi:hypothetical protein
LGQYKTLITEDLRPEHPQRLGKKEPIHKMDDDNDDGSDSDWSLTLSTSMEQAHIWSLGQLRGISSKLSDVLAFQPVTDFEHQRSTNLFLEKI